MFVRALKDAETVASRKRILFLIEATDGSAWAGSVSGVKAKLSLSGAAEVDSTNDIVRVGGYWHYVELTDLEAASGAGGDCFLARVPAASGRLEAPSAIEVYPDNPYDTALTNASIASAVWSNGTRTLSSFGSLVTDVRDAILTWELWPGLNLTKFLRWLAVLNVGESEGQNTLSPGFDSGNGEVTAAAVLDAQDNRLSTSCTASSTP